MRKVFLFLGAIISLGVWAEQSSAQTPSAVIVPNGMTQFSDANGKPLSDGTVFYYVPGSTTPKTTWQDPYQSTVNSNPVVLNGSGEALVWGAGIYREVVYDVNNNLIWDQLTGGYNCIGGGAVPGGVNGAIQYNASGILGGLPLGTSSQVLLGNASGPATWGSLPLAALPGGTTGTGPFVLENGATLNNPIINTPTITGGTWTGGSFVNPTFSGTITGLPGGGTTCTGYTYCIGSGNIIHMELAIGTPPTGGSVNGFAHDIGYNFAWNVYVGPGLLAQEEADVAAANIASIPAMQDQIRQIAAATHVQLK